MFINERPEENRHPEFDSEASLREADSRLGLKRVMEQYGMSPKNDNWKSFVCPFCKKKSKSAQVFEVDGTQMFKCYSTSCETATKAMPAVQFIAHKEGLSNKDAFVVYLKQAGVWKERTKLKGETQISHTPKPVQPPPISESGGEVIPEQSPAAPPSASAAPEIPAGPPSTEVPGPTPVEASGKPAPNADPAGANNADPACSKLPGAEVPTAPVLVPAAVPAPLPPHEPDGWRSLREFYSRLTLSDSDGDALFGKRGLFYVTSAALRFRSNPKSNRDILIDLEKKYGAEELLAAGLWLPEDRSRNKPRRPNSQFCGLGMTGKRKVTGREEQDSDMVWSWVQPILIPYFDETGELVSLRPHKGMGRSGTLVGTPHVYIPRGLGGALDGAAEVFYQAVITEGEFKAGAIWQVLGAGRSDGKQPVGVAAIPGISMAKNYEIREVLEDWLHRVKCREVIVVFDNEEKSDPKLEAYKADYRKRFDSQIWARYLATDLAQKLHIRGRVGNLPSAWRNTKGKADWDGAAVEIVRGKRLALAN